MLTAAAVERLKSLLRKLTKWPQDGQTAQNPRLEEEALRDALVLVKNAGPDGAAATWQLVKACLQSKNSFTRFLAMLLVDQILRRSRSFRRIVFEDLRVILQLIVEVSGMEKLPPPEEGKVILNASSVRLLERWSASFGKESNALGLALNFLESRHIRGRDIRTRHLTARSQRRALEQEQREERTQRILRAQFETVRREMSEEESTLQMMRDSGTQIVESIGLLEALYDEHLREEIEKENDFVKEKGNDVLVTQSLGKNNYNEEMDNTSDSEDDDDFDIDWSGVQIETVPDLQDTAKEEDHVDDDQAEWEVLDAEQERSEKRREEAEGLASKLPDNFKLSIRAPDVASPTLREGKVQQESQRRKNLIPILKSRGGCDAVLNALEEAITESSRSHLPVLNRWIRVLSRVEFGPNYGAQISHRDPIRSPSISFEFQRGKLLSTALSIRNGLQENLKRVKELGLHVDHSRFLVDYWTIFSAEENDDMLANVAAIETGEEKRTIQHKRKIDDNSDQKSSTSAGMQLHRNAHDQSLKTGTDKVGDQWKSCEVSLKEKKRQRNHNDSASRCKADYKFNKNELETNSLLVEFRSDLADQGVDPCNGSSDGECGRRKRSKEKKKSKSNTRSDKVQPAQRFSYPGLNEDRVRECGGSDKGITNTDFPRKAKKILDPFGKI